MLSWVAMMKTVAIFFIFSFLWGKKIVFTHTNPPVCVLQAVFFSTPLITLAFPKCALVCVKFFLVALLIDLLTRESAESQSQFAILSSFHLVKLCVQRLFWVKNWDDVCFANEVVFTPPLCSYEFDFVMSHRAFRLRDGHSSPMERASAASL